MPWNFPFWQVFRFGAPGLLGGNAVLLKHARNVTGCALALESLVRRAGFPEDLVRVLLVDHDEVLRLCGSPSVAAVTLTGSVEAGREVAAAAGRALKKTVLELGGSDPYVVLADADLDQAARACVSQRLLNGGQSCIAAKRFIVVEEVAGRFTELVVERMRATRWGDPLDEACEMGPLARHDLRDLVHDQVQRTVAAGAKLLLGGEVPQHAGAFYPPTVLSDVGPGMSAFDEEVFGPVASIVTAAGEEQALDLANATRFGLGAAVFTRDVARGEAIAAARLAAGACFVNAVVRSDPRLPFGGIKESGHGRELGSQGLRELLNVKAVWVSGIG
jgi:succinate-semialdehyde dehydrogenase/glutarate-semialdehyde dehydrogenase